MIRRILAAVPLIYCLGFSWFALFLPQPEGPRRTDAIVVFTGGPGRIDRAFAMLEARQAQRLFISGVAPDVRPVELAVQYGQPLRLVECCVVLGREAVDTRGNGDEVAAWLARRGYDSVRLITTDWHMRRSRFELERALPDTVTIVADAVPSRPRLSTLFVEYNKLLLRWAGAVVGI